MREKNIITPTQIRQLLKAWDSPTQLAQHPLAQMACVTQKLATQGQSDSIMRRSLRLKELLNEAIHALRVNDGKPQLHQPAWRPYIIITERYCFGRRPEWIMIHLSISSRTFYREMRTGTKRIAIFLQHLEGVAQTTSPHPSSTQPTPLILPPPSLPDYAIIGRESNIRTAVNLLIQHQKRHVALHGLPGVGKTTATLSLIAQSMIQSHFADGIIWLAIGSNPDIDTLLWQLGEQIGLSTAKIRGNRSQLIQRIRTQIATQKYLLVLDDVWDLDAAYPLCLGGQHTAHLLTTRHLSIALSFAGDAAIEIDSLNKAESAQVLRQLLPNLSTEAVPLAYVQKSTGGLPLALTIFGKYLHQQGYHGQKTRLDMALVALQQRDARLNLKLTHSPFGVQSSLPDGEKTSLAAVIGLSVDALSSSAQTMLKRLTIFPPKPNSFGQQAALYIVDDGVNSLNELVDSGLLDIMGADRFALHQIIHEYARPERYETAVIQNLLAAETAVITQHSPLIIQEQANIQTALRLGIQIEAVEATSKILLSTMRFLLDHGQIKQAEEWATETFAIAQTAEDQAAQARLHLCLGRIASRKNQPQQALRHVEQGWQLGEQHSLTDVVLQSKVVAIQTHLRQGNPNAARQLGDDIQHRLDESDDLIWQGYAYLSLSALDYFQGNYQRAFDHITLARQRFETSHHHDAMGSVYQNLGALSVELGHFDASATYYEVALGYFETPPTPPARNNQAQDQAGNPIRTAQILNNMGVLATKKGQWRKAITLHKKALLIRQENGDRNGQGQSLLNLSVVALSQKDVGQAQKLIAQGAKLSQEDGLRYRECLFHINQSWLASIQHNYAKALSFAQQAYSIATDIQRERSMGEAAAEMGVAHLRMAHYTKAEQWLLKARSIWQNNAQHHLLASTNVYLAQLNLFKKDLDKAEQYLENALVYLKNGIDGLDDAVEILQICAQILDALGDEKRSTVYKQKAIVTLKQQSGEIEETAVSRFYLNTYEQQP